MRFERGADSISVGPAGNQVEHAGRSQVNVIRSDNSGIDRIVLDDPGLGSGSHCSHCSEKRPRYALALAAGACSTGHSKPGSCKESKPPDSAWRARNIARRLQIPRGLRQTDGGWLAAVAVEIVLACIGVQDGRDESEEEEGRGGATVRRQ